MITTAKTAATVPVTTGRRPTVVIGYARMDAAHCNGIAVCTPAACATDSTYASRSITPKWFALVSHVSNDPV
jgi:hypothetical protein